MGQVLHKDEKLTSKNGAFKAIVQADGNFVVYAPGDKPIWASNTGAQGHIHLVMQGDGNLVLYNPYNPGQNERPIWDSKTFGKDTNARLIIQNDGNLVVYGSKFEKDVLWESKSTQASFADP